MAGGGGDGDGRGGEGVDVVVVGGGVGGLAASGLSARPNPRSRRVPAAGTRHEESNLEPRQLGAAEADHHRGRNALHRFL